MRWQLPWLHALKTNTPAVLQELESSLAASQKDVEGLRAANAKLTSRTKELEEELARMSHAHDEAVQVRAVFQCSTRCRKQ